MKLRLFACMLLLALFSCKRDPSDEELTDSVFGTWIPYMVVMSDSTISYEKDSAFFYDRGIRNKASFLSKGKMQENGLDFSYFIKDGNLNVINDFDTTVQVI